MSHVNLMTDTVIANLPPDGLRTVLRAILTTNPEITPVLENHTRTYLERSLSTHNEPQSIGNLQRCISLIRVMLGCGMWTRTLELISEILNQPASFSNSQADEARRTISSLDGDLIQTVTAIEKVQNNRELTQEERRTIERAFDSLKTYQASQVAKDQRCDFNRSLKALASVLGRPSGNDEELKTISEKNHRPSDTSDVKIETFALAGRPLPRLFTGLWQLSSPSWGTASKAQVFMQFNQYSFRGFTAYDMADHYGDAEVLFGEFKSTHHHPEQLFATTKLCIFQSVTVTPEFIEEKVSERCRRLNSNTVDLLQFHWQFYDDHQYIKALRLLEADKRISSLGLCNFDTKRMQEILSAGIEIVSNQVQFSLIDSRPTVEMGLVCETHDVKLLTYGTLCGGFIAAKWLGKPEPELFSDGITPSQRKYFEMITLWGGWKLFQELLRTLEAIAAKHKASISNVATRWVLDFPYVGAVLVGARMGVSEHIEDNLKVYGWKLDHQDKQSIDQILAKSRRSDIYKKLGDCGGEYRL